MSTDANAISIVRPLQITDAMLISTNVPETDYAAWASGTTYAVGNRVILTSTHKIYESLQNSNTGNNPVSSPTWWVEVSPTNRWKLFDTSTSTQTLNPGTSPPTISYTLRPGTAISAVAALNLTDITELRVRLVDGVFGTVFDETYDFSPLPLSSDWYAWFFGQRRAPTQEIVLGLPSFPTADLIVDMSGLTNLAIGVLAIGQEVKFGLGIRYGARVGIQDYSRKETNEFGDTVLIQRAFAKRAEFELLLAKDETDSFQNFLADIRAVPCVWVGSSEYESTVLFGFYKNFDILISYPQHSECDLEIEGLT